MCREREDQTSWARVMCGRAGGEVRGLLPTVCICRPSRSSVVLPSTFSLMTSV